MLTITSLPYNSSLIENYHSLSKLPGFVLLDSSDTQRGRYDIISAYPYERIQISAQERNIKAAYEKFCRRLQDLQQPSQCGLPFQGGAIGYISYDFGELMQGLDSMPHPQLKDMPLLDFGFYDWAIVVDHKTKTVSLISANQYKDTIGIVQEVRHLWRLTISNNSFSLTNPFKPLITRLQYEDAFRAIHADLYAGRAYQVNFTQPFVGEFRGDPWEMYKRVRAVNPVPFSAFLRLQDADVLSFSPERFLTFNERVLLTSPIKGSIRRSHCKLEDEQLKKRLEASSKNKAENVMIVDLLRNDLGKIAETGSVKVLDLCEVQSYNSVHHLVSNIEAKCLDNCLPLDAFLSCFPGGSITGAPKKEAMKIINEHEQFARGIYCGSIVYFSAHGSFDSSIAIRTMTANDDHLYLAAGGGIIIDSTYEEEYEECYTKIAAIVNQLNAGL